VYSIFPAHYYKTSLFKGRQKDYNLPLRRELVSSTPTETFDNISYYLSAGKRYAGFGANHPSDPDGQHKWGINERYHWVNFIPLLFGSNSTLEFRCHVPTRDPIKAINWLYICAAIIKYATKAFNSNVELSSLRKLTLIEVVNSVYSANLATYLSDYIRKRKMDRKSAETSGDYSGITEINNELKDIQMYKDISF
jgi:hypothetical protein